MAYHEYPDGNGGVVRKHWNGRNLKSDGGESTSLPSPEKLAAMQELIDLMGENVYVRWVLSLPADTRSDEELLVGAIREKICELVAGGLSS